MRRLSNIFELNAGSITIIYVAFGLLWILLSDQALLWVTNDPLYISQIQTFKGIIFVLGTGLFLYLLIYKSNLKREKEKEVIDASLFSAKSATWNIDLKTGKNRHSAKYHEIFGIEDAPDEWTMDDFFQLVHPDDRKKIQMRFNKALKRDELFEAEYRIVSPDGSTRWMRSRGNSIKNSEGKPVRFSGVVSDITEHKKLEKAYEKEHEVFKKIFNNIPVMISIFDDELNEIMVNNAVSDIMGYSRMEYLTSDIFKATYPDKEVRDRAIEVMQEADEEWHEFEAYDSQGNKHIQEWCNMKLEDNIYIGIGLDVTELKEKERALRDLALRYKDAEKLARFGHFDRNLLNGEISVSDGYFEVLGLKPKREDLTLDTLKKYIHPEDLDLFNRAMEKAMETGTMDLRYRFIPPGEDTIVHLHELGEVKYNESGEPIKISGTIQDISQRVQIEKKLKERTEFIESTVENLPIGVAVNEIDSGEVTLMNQQFSETYGWPKEILSDIDSFFEHVYKDDDYRQEMKEKILNDIQSGDPSRMSWKAITIHTQSGKKRIINAKNIPLFDQNLMISTVVDITDRIKAERKLAESEEKYRLLFEQNPLPMWIYNKNNLSFVEVNHAATRQYGYSYSEFADMTILDIRPESERKKLTQAIDEKYKNFSGPEDWIHQKKNGELINVRITGTSFDYYGEDHRLILAEDVTEQKKAEERILASMVEGEDKERARIARELHDGLGQYLAAARMNLNAVKSALEGLSEKKEKQFENGLNLLKQAINETTSISHNLLPRVVDDYGLALAIESLVDTYNKSGEIDVDYYHNLHQDELDKDVEFNLYRITQEALSNAIKHAEADKINVQLIKDDLDLILTIDDNGKGFDVSEAGFRTGLGLQTLKTRVGSLGGSLNIDSKPDKGTLIQVIVPLQN